MNCLKNNKQGTEILLAYAAGTLDAAGTASLEIHASGCGECRQLLDAQKRLWNLLDSIEVPEVSADFDERLYARIAHEEAHGAWKTGMVRWLRGFAPGSFLWNPISWKPIVAGAAVAVALGLGLYTGVPLHAPVTQPAAVQVRPEAVDAEQMEVTVEDLEMLMPPSAAAGRM